jgi:hypothetical protein
MNKSHQRSTVTVDDSIFSEGDSIFIANKASDACTITAGAGVTINSASGLALVTSQSGRRPTMKLSKQHQEAIKSYLRSAIAAVVAVIATLDYTPEDLAKAFVAALIPPVLRWINPKDEAFGRGSE